jgi:hypothetical protein
VLKKVKVCGCSQLWYWRSSRHERLKERKEQVVYFYESIKRVETIGAPSKLRFTRKSDALASMFPHFAFSKDENAARRKWKYDDSKLFISLIALTELLKLQKRT